MTLTDLEKTKVAEFLQPYFKKNIVGVPTRTDKETEREIITYVSSRFSQMKYILGLAIDFVVLAQRVSCIDPKYTPLKAGDSYSVIEERYPRIKSRGKKKANTLTLVVCDQLIGIRKTEEEVVDVFHAMQRTNFPSAYVYSTGQWAKYKELIILAFRLTEPGRFSTLHKLFQFGLENLERKRFFVRPKSRCRLFEEFLQLYPRRGEGELGGLTFQGLVYGFLSVEYAHLHIVSDKVRTGSSRQKRMGDIDLYYGLELELSVEVKDMKIDLSNFEHQLGTFIGNALAHRTSALIVCQNFNQNILSHIEQCRATILDDKGILELVQRWDWQKQDRALHGFLHSLAHIEQNPKAVERALKFISVRNPEHEVLAFMKIDEKL